MPIFSSVRDICLSFRTDLIVTANLSPLSLVGICKSGGMIGKMLQNANLRVLMYRDR